ncbi:MAG: ATP-binding cassette domain-containing protein [Candidatus Dormibacteria bacterium]
MILEVTRLDIRFRRRDGTFLAVAGLSFKIESGETVALVGESGCGKTVTGLSIMQLLPPGASIAAGSIQFEGRELVGLPDKAMGHLRGAQIAMLFQDPMTSLNPTMTVGDQIVEAVRVHRKVSRRDALERAAEVLGLTQVPRPRERLSDFPHQLSGGLRQRVLLAMALACEPRLLIADEPADALDRSLQVQILELLDGMRHRFGMAVLLLTRDSGLAAGRADQIKLMRSGRIADDATAGDVAAGPRPNRPIPLSAWGLK